MGITEDPDPAMATTAATAPFTTAATAPLTSVDTDIPTTVDMPRLTTVTDIDRVYRPAYDTGGYIPRRADRASGAIPGPDFFVRTVPWFHGERLRDTSHRTIRSIERRGNSGGSR